MALSAPHPCTAPGCRTLVPRGRARCDVHESKHQAQDRERRGSAHARGYDTRWQRYRLSFLATHPLCVMCQEQGRVVAASVVDHIKAHKGDQQLFWDPTNHRAVCKPCHDARTDEGDFGRTA